MTVILELYRLQQKDYEFEANLKYRKVYFQASLFVCVTVEKPSNSLGVILL